MMDDVPTNNTTDTMMGLRGRLFAKLIPQFRILIESNIISQRTFVHIGIGNHIT